MTWRLGRAAASRGDGAAARPARTATGADSPWSLRPPFWRARAVRTRAHRRGAPFEVVGCREVVLGTTVTRKSTDHIVDMFPVVARSGAHSCGWRSLAIPEGFEAAARKQLEASGQDPWDTVGLSVRLEGDGVMMFRHGVATPLPPGQTVRWGRLDVVWSGSSGSSMKVVLDGGRVIEVAAGSVSTFASLAAAVPAALVAEVDRRISRALAGDERAIAELEPLLPIAHARLRARLEGAPTAAADDPGGLRGVKGDGAAGTRNPTSLRAASRFGVASALPFR